MGKEREAGLNSESGCSNRNRVVEFVADLFFANTAPTFVPLDFSSVYSSRCDFIFSGL